MKLAQLTKASLFHYKYKKVITKHILTKKIFSNHFPI